MNNKWKRSLSLLLMLALLLALPMASAFAADDDESFTLTVVPGGAALTDEDSGMEDFLVDLYQVATAEKDAVSETYNYTAVGAFSGVTIPSVEDPRASGGTVDADALQADWIAAAAAAAAIAPGATPDKSAQAVNTAITLDPGLYLVVAYSADLAAAADHFDDDGNSIAQSDRFIYTYAPQLVAVPGVDAEAAFEGDVYKFYPTAGGNWGDVEAVLKPERDYRMTGMSITKILDHMNLSTQFAGRTSTFVFEVSYTLADGPDGAEVTHKYVLSLNFDSAATKTVTLEDLIPVGVEIRVEEVYPGAAYISVDGTTRTFTSVVDPAENTASFENDWGDVPFDAGYGIENNYVLGEDGLAPSGTDGSTSGADVGGGK